VARYARSSDDRLLAYEMWGDPRGTPIFLLHGTPGCRLGPRPRPHELALMGIRLIAYDRPGYGLSDRSRGRRVADAADDVERIADSLGLDRFAVLGRSGGAPHALACAARLPDRVTGVGALAGLAPCGAPGLDWYAGMDDGNVCLFSLARRVVEGRADPTLLAGGLSLPRQAVTDLAFLGTDLPDDDRRVLLDPGIRGLLVENIRHASGVNGNALVLSDSSSADADERSVAVGRIDDVLALTGDWGFALEDIAVPALLWHGEDDIYSPVTHARWLASRIPGATLVVEPGTGHFGSLIVLPSVLEWLRRPVATAGGPPAQSW
jgi:pimeloyl-ACP methyl ester carboxylesterase